MRIRSEPQGSLPFGLGTNEQTRKYYTRYERIDQVLRANPEILDLAHEKLRDLLRRNRPGGRKAELTSETLFRSVLVMVLEGWALREAVLRIDDSSFFRWFVRIGAMKMMDHSMLGHAHKRLEGPTWRAINDRLTAYARETNRIEGQKLRVDTTVYETNVHYPTDARLLWDGMRVLSRLIGRVRGIDAGLVGTGRLQDRRVKKQTAKLNRLRGKARWSRSAKRLYTKVFRTVGRTLAWAGEVAGRIRAGRSGMDVLAGLELDALASEIAHYLPLVARVLDQAERRILHGEKVPHDEKLFSIFEPHTELIIRGKAGKDVEFGHMVQIAQVEGKYISDYAVFQRRPDETGLVDGILAEHEKRFDALPEHFTADKGYYKSMKKIRELEREIEVVSIAKKGSRTEKETARETSPLFKELQKFRAGIEGTISYLKRCLRFARCYFRSFETYAASVGAIVFCHNLIVLSKW